MQTIIRIDTELGSIRIALDGDAAPITTTNFLAYVDEGLYDGGDFHRTVRLDNQSNDQLDVDDLRAGIDREADRKQLPNDEISIEVIQGGINPDREGDLGPAIPLERTSETGLSHLDGTISMARLTPDSAIAEFFICINDQPELDFGGQRNPDGQGFAAFGRVVEGMDVVRAIQGQPSEGQQLHPPVTITRIVREPDGR